MSPGCSTMTVDTFQEPKETIYKENFEAPGVMVYIKPMLNDAETEKLFGVNLIKKNILAMYVSVWNTSPDKNFIITEESFKVTQIESYSAVNRPEKGSQSLGHAALGASFATDLVAQGVATAATYSAAAVPFAMAALPAALAIQLYASNQYSDASVIKENFEIKKFRATTLEPGEKESGYLYYNWDDLKGYEEVNLCLSLQDPKSDEIHLPCFYVSLGGNKDAKQK